MTPDPYHAPLTLQALKAGKHVMCEKPLALNHRDAQRMLAAAVKAKRIHMVNLSYRNWSALQAVAKLVHGGGLGEIRHVEASYLQSWLVGNHWGDWRTSPTWLWRLSQKHGSQGVLGDIGVHFPPSDPRWSGSPAVVAATATCCVGCAFGCGAAGARFADAPTRN